MSMAKASKRRRGLDLRRKEEDREGRDGGRGCFSSMMGA